MSSKVERRKIRCYVSGCFDLFHLGHLNALRQVKQYDLRQLVSEEEAKDAEAKGLQLEDLFEIHVVAGIISNTEIRKVKGGAFINSEAEKERLLLATRFVDEVVRNVKYVSMLAEDYNCDFVFHGDDLVISSNGIDYYGEAKARGNFRVFRRTEGVSTTLLINRILATLQQRPIPTPYANITGTRISSFFGNRINNTMAGKKVVYVEGTWDLFHLGHLNLLEAIREDARRRFYGIDESSPTEIAHFQLADVEMLDNFFRERNDYLMFVDEDHKCVVSKNKLLGNIDVRPLPDDESHELEFIAKESRSLDDHIFLLVGVKHSDENSQPLLQTLPERATALLSLDVVDDIVLEIDDRGRDPESDQTFRRSLGIDLIYNCITGVGEASNLKGSVNKNEVTLYYKPNYYSTETVIGRVRENLETFQLRQTSKTEPVLTEFRKEPTAEPSAPWKRITVRST